MRKVNFPQLNGTTLLDSCIQSIVNSKTKEKILNIRQHMLLEYNAYISNSNLISFHLQSSFSGKENDVVVADVTCAELKDLYSSQMVPSTKPSRKEYDILRSSASNSICPFCGFGHVSTLEHYLPKSKYPLLSVLPENLVPCCSDCNSGVKCPSSEEEQCFHPYFEDDKIFNEQWLYAKVQQGNPYIVTYLVAPPFSWGDVLVKRAEKHFESFKLNRRFSVESSTELSMLNHVLRDTYSKLGKDGVMEHLKNNFTASAKVHTNHWKTAVYQALYLSNEYCDGGFLVI